MYNQITVTSYSISPRIEGYLAFKICSTIKYHLTFQYEFYLYLSPLPLLLIFYALSISLLSLIPVSNSQTVLLSRTEGVDEYNSGSNKKLLIKYLCS
jgi:hypothetical protein